MESGRIIQSKIEIPAPLGEVWTAWTTESGAKTFFAPECSLDLRPLGAYEMYFDLEAEPGLQGGEGCRVLAVQPMAMLSFTWNAPPHLPEVRGQYTHVVVRFKTASETVTRVSLVHAGWGEGGQWDQAFDYFNSAWKKVVLPRLAYRFTVGPVDWSSPPDLAAFIEV